MNIKKKIILAGLLTAAASSAAFAAYYPSHYVERMYFDSAAKIHSIGESTLMCNGRTYSTGESSQHYNEIKFSCGVSIER